MNEVSACAQTASAILSCFVIPFLYACSVTFTYYCLLTQWLIYELSFTLFFNVLQTFCNSSNFFFFLNLHSILLLSRSLSTLISLPFCFLPFVRPTLFLPSLYRVLSPFPPSFLASLRPGTVYNLLLFPKTPFFFVQLSHLPILVPVDKLVIAPYVESMTLRSWNRMAMYGLGKSPKDNSEPDRTVMSSD